MGFFDRLYYGKAGQRDYTEMDMPKNRISLFFQVLKDHFFDLVKVNFLQLVFWTPFLLWSYLNFAVIQSIDVQALPDVQSGNSLLGAVGSYVMIWLIGLIPCITITGPSSAGSAYIMRNWARDQHAFLFSDYKDAFKSNWKQALLTSLLTSVIPVMAYTAVLFYANAAIDNALMILPLIVILSAVIMWALMLPLIYPLMVGYELRFKHMLKNAGIMAVASLPKMVFARLVTLTPIIILAVAFFTGSGIAIFAVMIYYLLFGFAFSRLVYASIAHGIFDKYLNPHIEGAVVRQGLRPQMDEDEIFDDDDEEEYDDEEAAEDA